MSEPIGEPARRRAVDVLVVGAGPAGLTAAAELARTGAHVEVLERESEPGGTPRHCFHTGYGVRDLHRVLTGPAYVRRLADTAAAAGADVRAGVSVTGWAGPLALRTTSRGGLEELTARAVVLATGARERPRAARWIPGGRGEGVYTTGLLQQLVYLHRRPVGRRAVVVGAEHVSFSALVTLAHAGTRVAALVTEHPAHQTWPAFRLGAAARYGVPIVTGVRVTRILGRRRVEGIELLDGDGRLRVIGCDTVVLTGDWVPDHELARQAGLAMDLGTRGPRVDLSLRTSAAGVFAAGNLLHPVETADVCALDGRAVARSVEAFLAGTAGAVPSQIRADPGRDVGVGLDVGVDIAVEAPLRWIAPNRISSTAQRPPRGRFVAASDLALAGARLTVEQAGSLLASVRLPRRVAPNRPFGGDAGWVGAVDPAGGPVRLRV